MEQKTVRVVAIGVVSCVVILLVYAAVITFQASRIERQASQTSAVDRNTREIRRTVDNAHFPGERSLQEVEAWVPRDFFERPETLGACEAISSREHERLREMIDRGLEVNAPGKAGMTLLCWAYVCGNLDAFELLLESGADPDKRLTEAIVLSSKPPLSPGDSILFTCIRQSKWQFFFAAFSHTRDVNQRDGGGSSLLHVAMRPSTIFSVSPEALQRLVDSGIDLDAQDKHGGTAAVNAIIWKQPRLCLQLLKSGANPDLRNDAGQTVADILAKNTSSDLRRGAEFLPKGVDQLEEWLQSHGTQAGNEP
jgi:ankyrin repeat protein